MHKAKKKFGQNFLVDEQIIADIIGFRGNVKWDTSKPDGISRKLLDNTRMSELGWQPKTMFSEGLRKTYEAYITLIGQNT